MNKLIISLPLFVTFAAAAFSIALLFVYYNAAYGQTQTTPQQIVDNTKAECASLISAPADVPEIRTVLAESCISLVHESPTMVVLTGDLLISTSPALYSDNVSIWKAVNNIKDSGYSITSVEVAGQGSQANPHKLYVVMSK